MSSSVLHKILPARLQDIDDTVKKFSVYACAKQYRLPFPSSCIKSTTSFEQLHMDVWGLYKVQTFDGNIFFLTIVDDFTRMTWVLLKLKSDVCMVIHIFQGTLCSSGCVYN